MKTPVAILGTAVLCALLAPVLTLGGCHHPPAARAAMRATSRAVVLSQARLVLPAVKGDPGAAYFQLTNGSAAPVTLVHVDVVGAKASQMHETSGGAMQPLALVPIAPGEQVAFAPSAKHVMVFGLAPTLLAGNTSTIVLHFQNGRTTSAPLLIEAAGGAGAMAGMVMSAKP